MIVLGILVSIAAIGTMCWLLFNLAVFALPFFIGLNAGTWAYGTGLAGLAASLSVLSPPVLHWRQVKDCSCWSARSGRGC